MFKKIVSILLLLCVCIPVLADKSESLFPMGYFTNPVLTPYGVIASNDRQSTIYLINGVIFEELISAPGAGRFLHFNKEKDKIGFKLIDPASGLQAPAVLDLKTREIILLENKAPRVGQVSFADDGAIAYTIDTKLIVRRGERVETYNLDVYSNRTPISPDGNRVAYKDNSDQLWILHLHTGERYTITDPEKGYRGSHWSPQGDKLVYSSIGTDLYYHDIAQRQSVFIGEGENPNWSPSGDKLVFHRKEIDFQNIELLSSDIFIYEFETRSKKRITATDDVFEMDARFIHSDDTIIFHTYDAREIRTMRIDGEKGEPGLFKESPLLKLDTPLETTQFTFGEVLSQDTVIAGDIDWVHIHQVYDTRSNWDQGRVCCGAATIAQVFATYGIFTPWPFQTYGHISNYGLYISDPYTFNGITYTGYSGRWPSGGHGYLWHGGGSPRSRTVQYVTGHGIFETQRDDNVTWNTVTTELDLGYSYVLCSTGLTSGHIVLAIGTYGNQNTVVVNDPYGDKNAGNYGWVYNGKHALYDWADANTGRQKVTPIAWGVRIRFDQEEIPTMISYSPDTQDSVHATTNITITFSQPMDRDLFADAFSITPEINGTFSWSNLNRTVTFKPDDVLKGATSYTVRVDTLAKNIFGMALEESLEFGFLTRARQRLIVEETYPIHEQSGISTTVQFRVRFDKIIPRAALMGNLALYDANDVRISLANSVIEEIDGKGNLAFETRNELQHNHRYRLFLYADLYDLDGYTIGDTVVVDFYTVSERYIGGTILDDFPDCGNWSICNNDEGSSNVDIEKTTFNSSTQRKVSGTTSARLEYVFIDDEGVLSIANHASIILEPGHTENFGLWTYGDLSGNILEFHFLINGTEDRIVTVDTLNYTGWKLVTTDLNDNNPADEVEFTGIALKKVSDGNTNGILFFDQLQKDIVTPVTDRDEHFAIREFRLYQNYPNPFNPSTSIAYDIPQNSHVQISVYNVLGQQVAILVDESLTAGNYETVFDASRLPTGLYIYRLRAGDYTETKSLLYLK